MMVTSATPRSNPCGTPSAEIRVAPSSVRSVKDVSSPATIM